MTPTQNFDTTTGQSQPHQEKPTPQATATSMIKKLSITISCLLLMAGLSYGQSASFSFNDNNGTPNVGTYNPTDTLTLSLFGLMTGMPVGYSASGFSLWLEVPTASGFNTAISITSSTVFQFPDKTQPTYPKVFDSLSGAQAGYMTDRQGTASGDLGATSNDPSQNFANGFSAHLADYSFSLSGVAPGTYVMFTTVNSPKKSGISYDDGSTFLFASAPAASYTFTVVPEPSTWSLVAIGAVGAVGFSILRRRQRA